MANLMNPPPAPPVNAPGPGNVAPQAPQGYSLTDFLADVNGATGYTEDQAAMGTIKDGYFLQMHIGTQDLFVNDFKTSTDTPPNFTQTQRATILELNYRSLVDAGLRESTANFLATLRYMMVKSGFLLRHPQDRCVYVDEVKWVNTTYERFDRFKPDAATTKFVATYWHNIVAVVAHVFRVRGHHYKPEFDKLYTRTWASTTIEVPNGVSMPSWEEIARAGLHCFGVAALHKVREYAHHAHTLSKSLELRRDAACAGSAPIRTAAAAIMEMRSMRWWDAFRRRFEREIDDVMTKAHGLTIRGTSAHINAKLYDWNDIYQPVGEESVITLAPYICGWLDTLDIAEPIRGQQCLNKRCTGGLSIKQQFSQVILNELRNDRSLATVADFLRGSATMAAAPR